MSPWQVLVYLIASAVIFGIPGYFIGRPKGRGSGGFYLGWLLGIIGVIIIACLKPNREALIRREQERLRIQQEAAARMGGYAAEPEEPGSGPVSAWREARRFREPGS